MVSVTRYMSTHITGSIGQESRKLAMLIDGDNAEAKLLGKVLHEASRYGTIMIRRIYWDWSSANMSRWRSEAHKYAFQTPHQLSYTKGKNATDTFMIIDAMDILYSGNADGFCIVSSDSDFTGLAKRIREQGVFVMGMGRKTTPESFIRACEVFTYVEILSDSSEIDAVNKSDDGQDTASDLQKKSRHEPVTNISDWEDIALKAIEITGSDEWANLADVGSNILKIDPSFDVRSYGSKKMLQLFKTAPEHFEIREEKHDGYPSVYYVKIALE